LTTTFPQHDPWNIDKPGQWRQINFFVEPYYWPPPLELHNEGYWGNFSRRDSNNLNRKIDIHISVSSLYEKRKREKRIPIYELRHQILF
jgi:hypothetical protein